MELVPIITQILTIVAAVFIIVLLVSYIASKVRKKGRAESLNVASYSTNTANAYSITKNAAGKNQYYNGSCYNGDTLTYPKEIKVVKRTGEARIPSPGKNYSSNNYRETSAYSNSRFTVINNISPNVPRKIETDEYGFKLYTDKEITRSVYLPG